MKLKNVGLLVWLMEEVVNVLSEIVEWVSVWIFCFGIREDEVIIMFCDFWMFDWSCCMCYECEF